MIVPLTEALKVVNMETPRQDPEILLRAIKKDEANAHRGHLKIFFGYAAGVGKTYAMLKAAHSAKQNGIDVVAGYVCLLYTSKTGSESTCLNPHMKRSTRWTPLCLL